MFVKSSADLISIEGVSPSCKLLTDHSISLLESSNLYSESVHFI